MPGHSPSDLQAHIGYWLRTVSNAVSYSFARKLQAVGVTVAEWVFLRMLYDCDGLAPSLLAGRMGMTKGAISKLADRLVDKALVDRGPSRDPGRGQLLALRPAARALVPDLAALADRNDAEFFAPLSGDEREQLGRLLRKLTHAHRLATPPTE
jgi:DNA-binding MarR family transcriptional regulator